MESSAATPLQQGRLLRSLDPEPYRVYNELGTTPLLLVCDHASNFIPPHLDNLGLNASVLGEHVAWDPGAAEVTELICQLLDCRAVLANYSRLLIDLNRDPKDQDPSMIPDISDGYQIAGNQNLSHKQQQARIDEIMEPYHLAIERQLRSLSDFAAAPLIFSIHTFTPMTKGCTKPRRWHAGMLWRTDPRIAQPLMNHLQQHDHLVIGDNEPYSGREIAYTVDRHGHNQGFPNCAIEIRQDLLKDHSDCKWWAEHLAHGLDKVLENDDIHQVKFFNLEDSYRYL